MRFTALFALRRFCRYGPGSFSLFSLLILFCATSTALPAQADNSALKARIVALFTQSAIVPPAASPVLNLTLLTPPAQLATLCAAPALSLSGGLSRAAGMHSVIAQCGSQRRFIQVTLEITATWWQAAHAISPGQLVTRDDIHAQRGSLTHAPAGLIFDPLRIAGRIAQRRINPGEPLVESQLRQKWTIQVGQKVDMIYVGNGFSIRATGKALDNAVLNARFRLQSASGQIITATAIAPGKARVAAD